MIYPEQRGDYCPKSWNATEFDIQFDILTDEEAFAAVAEDGFIRLNLIEKIAEIIKGFFGGTDYSQKQRVQAVWLKFLYYGEAHGFIKEEHIERLGQRMSYPSQSFDPAMGKLFKELSDYRRFADGNKSEHLQSLRNIVTDYHRHHAMNLRPGFWTRVFTNPPLEANKILFFGDTPLLLSEKALEQEIPDPRLALSYLQKAFDLKNDSPDFKRSFLSDCKSWRTLILLN